MFQIKEKKELEVFEKNRKRNIIIIFVLGILMMVGVIALFRTFAFYKKEKLDYLYSMHLNSVKVENKEVNFIPERGLYTC